VEKKLNRIVSPMIIFCFIAMVGFTAAAFALKQWYLAAGELFVTAVLGLVYILRRRRRVSEIRRLVGLMSQNFDIAVNDTIAEMPLPIVMLRVDGGELVWCNKSFAELTGVGGDYYGSTITSVVPDFDMKWIVSGADRSPAYVRVGERFFDLEARTVLPAKEDASLFAVLYWTEKTEEVILRTKADDDRRVVAQILCDNYEELIKAVSEAEKGSMMAELDGLLREWAARTDGLLTRVERDRYLFFMNEKGLRHYTEQKFAILEAVKKIVGPNGMPMTVSIGIGRDGQTLEETSRFADLALEMALSRGGDQTVIKNRLNFEFFGGLTKEIEKRTRVKTRLMAGALKGLLAESSTVYVMGHRIADLDSLGSAAGMVCAARAMGKKARIVINRNYSNAGAMIAMLEENPLYADVFVNGEQAMVDIDINSLLVVVDTNRASYVEDKSLLESFNRVVVIDHHRRVADYIQNAALNIHEPAASSVCELIAEMLEYMVDSSAILRTEASAMLAGIFLDTKSFTLKTGSRTFEAAAFLRRAGADGVEVKRLFQNDLDNYIQRVEIVKRVSFVNGRYAIAVSDKPVDRAVAAQAADDLMNITGVAGSFVLFPFEDTVSISARSLGRINVQIIMERLGGGGHFTTAGAQLKGKSLNEAASMLMDAITLYSYEYEQNREE